MPSPWTQIPPLWSSDSWCAKVHFPANGQTLPESRNLHSCRGRKPIGKRDSSSSSSSSSLSSESTHSCDETRTAASSRAWRSCSAVLHQTQQAHDFPLSVQLSNTLLLDSPPLRPLIEQRPRFWPPLRPMLEQRHSPPPHPHVHLPPAPDFRFPSVGPAQQPSPPRSWPPPRPSHEQRHFPLTHVPVPLPSAPDAQHQSSVGPARNPLTSILASSSAFA